MKIFKHFIMIALAMTTLAGCLDNDSTKITEPPVVTIPETEPEEVVITDVVLTEEDEAQVKSAQEYMRSGNYAAASALLEKLTVTYIDSIQLNDLYSKMLAELSGISPREFAIAMGTVAIDVIDENGTQQSVKSSMSFMGGLISLANVQDNDDYQMRLWDGREAIKRAISNKDLLILPVAEKADIGAMALIHVTRLTLGILNGDTHSVFNPDSELNLSESVAVNLPSRSEELVESLNLVALTIDSVNEVYPIKEITDNPLLSKAIITAINNTLLDDNVISNEEAVDVITYIAGL